MWGVQRSGSSICKDAIINVCMGVHRWRHLHLGWCCGRHIMCSAWWGDWLVGGCLQLGPGQLMCLTSENRGAAVAVTNVSLSLSAMAPTLGQCCRWRAWHEVVQWGCHRLWWLSSPLVLFYKCMIKIAGGAYQVCVLSPPSPPCFFFHWHLLILFPLIFILLVLLVSSSLSLSSSHHPPCHPWLFDLKLNLNRACSHFQPAS